MGSRLGRELADWLAARMRARKMTKSELHSESGVSRPTIDNILAGDRQHVEQDTLERLSKALGIVPAVRIEPSLTAEPEPEPETPEGILERIEVLTRRARALLEEQGTSQPPATPAGPAQIVAQAVQRPAKPQRGKKSRRPA